MQTYLKIAVLFCFVGMLVFALTWKPRHVSSACREIGEICPWK
jgi:hypothetical protein